MPSGLGNIPHELLGQQQKGVDVKSRKGGRDLVKEGENISPRKFDTSMIGHVGLQIFHFEGGIP